MRVVRSLFFLALTLSLVAFAAAKHSKSASVAPSATQRAVPGIQFVRDMAHELADFETRPFHQATRSRTVVFPRPAPRLAPEHEAERKQRQEKIASTIRQDQMTVSRLMTYYSEKVQGVAHESAQGRYGSPEYNDLGCSICKTVAKPLSELIRSNLSRAIIQPVAIGLCEVIKPECTSPSTCTDICSHIVPEYTAEVLQIASETLFDPSFLCWKLNLCPAPPPPPPFNHFVPVPSNCSDHSGEGEWPAWNVTTGTGYFVQMSDIHLDPKYVAGTNTQCGEPLCCRAINGPGTGNNSAGVYGDYNCDATTIMVESLLSHIAELNPAPDFILYTGDDPPHDVWIQSRDWNLSVLKQLNQMMRTYFPHIPVFSAIGNHESFPVNQFEGSPYDSWLYDVVNEEWDYWLCDDARATIAFGGYYSCRVRPGLRVVSLNTNFWTNDNFWLYVNNSDFSHQLDWTNDVLRQAEALKEKVIFIGHAHVATWKSDFSKPFLSMMQHYRDTILASFFGHSHSSSVNVIHDTSVSPPQPMTTSYVVGSVTPYTLLNPGYRHYFYDRAELVRRTSASPAAPQQPPKLKKTHPSARGPKASIRIASDELTLLDEVEKELQADTPYNFVMDYQQFILNLTEANLKNTTDWTSYSYRASELFNFTVPLTPQQWADFGLRLRSDKALFDTYQFWYFKGAVAINQPYTPIALSCDVLTATDAEYDTCMHSNSTNSHLLFGQSNLRHHLESHC